VALNFLVSLVQPKFALWEYSSTWTLELKYHAIYCYSRLACCQLGLAKDNFYFLIMEVARDLKNYELRFRTQRESGIQPNRFPFLIGALNAVQSK